jgi:hypothetical protein
MTKRYYGMDILKLLNDLATNATNGVNAVITAINTERSLTGDNACPAVKNITTSFPKGFLPEMIIDIDSSELLEDDESIGGGGSTFATRDTNKTPEVYKVLISIMHKSNNTQMYNWMEIFAEAIYRTFHNYCDSNVTWMIATSSIRSDLQIAEGQTGKICGYEFDLRIDHA